MWAGLKLWTHLLLDACWPVAAPRIPEPDALMDSAAQTRAYLEAGSDDGALAFLQFFHALQASPLIRPGDRVVDLACGPATQLRRLAELHPDASFVGVDASGRMLDAARRGLASGRRLHNVALVQADIRDLGCLHDAAADVVTCTMSLHHLDGAEALRQVLGEARRVLRPSGGVYLADFGRLRRARTQEVVANDRRDLQSAQFTQDFRQSLAAAFSAAELRLAIRATFGELGVHVTPLAPFMVIARSACRRDADANLGQRVEQAYRGLGATGQQDFHALSRWFTLGGLGLPYRRLPGSAAPTGLKSVRR